MRGDSSGWRLEVAETGLHWEQLLAQQGATGPSQGAAAAEVLRSIVVVSGMKHSNSREIELKMLVCAKGTRQRPQGAV
jgi:hypothetical protein